MILGTAVKIAIKTVVDGSGTVNTAVVTVTDPDGTELLTEQAMDNDGDGEFSYVWQSPADGDPGYYRADTKASTGSYDSLARTKFELES